VSIAPPKTEFKKKNWEQTSRDRERGEDPLNLEHLVAKGGRGILRQLRRPFACRGRHKPKGGPRLGRGGRRPLSNGKREGFKEEKNPLQEASNLRRLLVEKGGGGDRANREAITASRACRR